MWSSAESLFRAIPRIGDTKFLSLPYHGRACAYPRARARFWALVARWKMMLARCNEHTLRWRFIWFFFLYKTYSSSDRFYTHELSITLFLNSRHSIHKQTFAKNRASRIVYVGSWACAHHRNNNSIRLDSFRCGAHSRFIPKKKKKGNWKERSQEKSKYCSIVRLCNCFSSQSN